MLTTSATNTRNALRYWSSTQGFRGDVQRLSRDGWCTAGHAGLTKRGKMNQWQNAAMQQAYPKTPPFRSGALTGALSGEPQQEQYPETPCDVSPAGRLQNCVGRAVGLGHWTAKIGADVGDHITRLIGPDVARQTEPSAPDGPVNGEVSALEQAIAVLEWRLRLLSDEVERMRQL